MNIYKQYIYQQFPLLYVSGWIQLDADMRNITRHMGQTIHIRCEITGSPIPSYQWFKEGDPVEELGGYRSRINVRGTHWGSSYV